MSRSAHQLRATGAVLDRRHTNPQDSIARSLNEVRLTAGVQNREQISVAGFIDALTDAATLEASARGRTLTVSPVETGLTIEVDQKVLSAVVAMLDRDDGVAGGAQCGTGDLTLQ